MFDVTSNAFWKALVAGAFKVITSPGMDIQLYLSAMALAIAFLISSLIQRIARRHWKEGSKYSWVSHSLLPGLLSPFLAIIMLALAHGTAIYLVPFMIHQHTIAAFVKIAMVWLAACGLLLIAQRHFMAYFVSSVMLLLALLSVTNLLAPAQASLNEITFEASNFRLSLLGAIKGVFTLIVLFWGAGMLTQTGERWLKQLPLSINARVLSTKFLRIMLYFIAFVMSLNQMGVDLTALTVFGGAFAVGIGFGLQKITSNLLSGIILLFERTVEVGDMIEVGNERGWVREMAIRHTMIETADGRELLIPNEDLIIGKVTNWTYTNTRARVEISATVIYDSDADKVQKLLIAAAKDYPSCLSEPAPTCQLREFNSRGMQFMLQFWIPDIKEGLNAAKSEVMFRIVRAFRANKIAFATE